MPEKSEEKSKSSFNNDPNDKSVLKKVSFEGIEPEKEIFGEDSSSEESCEDEEDYFENQRLQIKSGSDAKFSENKSKKSKKGKKSKKPAAKDPQHPAKDLPMIEQMIQEKQQKGKELEEEKNQDLVFVEGEKFRQQLIVEELERKKRAERQKDLEEMQRLQEKFKNEIEENKRKKKEQKIKELDEQALLVQEQKYMGLIHINIGFYRKFIEEQQRLFEEKTKMAWDNYKKEEEESQRKSKIEEEMKGVLMKIKKFESGSSLGVFFDENISLMKTVSAMPEEAFQTLKDQKAYMLSRFGITKKFQILIFPFLEDESFLSEFLGYFIRNSCFLKQLNEPHFSFHLIGFHISAFNPVISDEEDDLFCYSSYLTNATEFRGQISDKKFKRCIYMLFDTYIGEGSQIMGDVVLDVKILKNVITERCAEKLRKRRIFDFDEKMTLKAFAIKHMKSMKLATKLFHHVTTFHPVSMQTGKQHSEQATKSADICIVFLKKFPEKEVQSFSPVDNMENNKEDIPIPKKTNVLSELLKRTANKGLDLISLKTIYFHEEKLPGILPDFRKVKVF